MSERRGDFRQQLLDKAISKLKEVKGPAQDGTYTAFCPFHADGEGKPPHNANLKIWPPTESDKGGFNCVVCGEKGGLWKLCEKLGIAFEKSSEPKATIVKTYPYLSAEGKLLYEVVRLEPKDFRQRRPDGHGGYIWNLKGIPRVLYRLPELLARPGDRAHIVEGEKDADRLTDLGLLATTNVGGANKWTSAYNEPFRGREVIILGDNDEPGRKHTQQVALALHGVAASVKIIFMPDPAKDVSEYLDAGHSKDDLLALIGSAPIWVPELPVVKVGTQQWSETMTLGWNIIAPRSVYLWDITPKRLVAVNVDEFDILNENNLSAMLARGAKWVDKSGAPINGVPRKLISDMMGDLLNNPPLPAIRRFVRSPLLMPNGEIIAERRYYANSELYYVGPTTPEPNTAAKDELLARMQKGFETFPFAEGDAARANAFALAVAPFLTEYTGSPIPGFLIVAPQQKVGKSLIVRTIHIGVTDCDIALHPLPINDEQEFRKRLTSDLLEEPVFICHDNERDGGTLSSPWISGLLGTRRWKDRLFREQRDLDIEVRPIFIVTGNNVSLDKDLSVRFVLIELESNVPNPESIVFADPLPEAMIVRSGQWRGAVLKLLSLWHSEGAPKSSVTFGTFTAFVQAVGGFLDWCGIPGFMTNRNRMSEVTEDPCDPLKIILPSWIGEHGLTAELAAKDIVALFEKANPEFIAGLKKDTPPGRAVAAVLKKVVGRTMELDDHMLIKLRRVPDKHSKAWRYKFAVVKGPPSNQTPTDQPAEKIESHAEDLAEVTL